MAKEPKVKKTKEEISKICSSSVKTSKVHERRVANLLTEWSGVPFRRRRIQGREGALRMAELAADVIPTAGDFDMSVECKKGKDFSLEALMANQKTSKFSKWWLQCCYDAQLVSQDQGRTVYPFMFFKPEPAFDWVAFSANMALRPKDGLVLRPQVEEAVRRGDRVWWFPHLLFDEFAYCGPVEGDISHSAKHPKMVSIDLDPVVICRWREFERSVDPKSTFTRFPGQDEIEKACLEDKGLNNGLRVQ